MKRFRFNLGIFGALALTACQQQYGLDFTGTGLKPVLGTEKFSESFDVGVKGDKKVDFLFVVDNSGSMEDNQNALRAGFAKFADTFYRRDDLDICTYIITTDRFLGRNTTTKDAAGATVPYDRERSVSCTRTPDWKSQSEAQRKAYIDSVINEFNSKVLVGIRGSGDELVGKSLATYLQSLDKWGGKPIPGAKPFFRPDAVANVSILTDENNWYQMGITAPGQEPFSSGCPKSSSNSNCAGVLSEARNDIPAVTGSSIFWSAAPIGSKDTRKGIKDYLDEYFNKLNPGKPPTYSVTAMLSVASKPNPNKWQGYSQAENARELVYEVGRDSAIGDIEATPEQFARIYDKIGGNIVVRAYSFHLAHLVYDPSKQTILVNLAKADGSYQQLAFGSDFTLKDGNALALRQDLIDSAQPGDKIEVLYLYKKVPNTAY